MVKPRLGDAVGNMTVDSEELHTPAATTQNERQKDTDVPLRASGEEVSGHLRSPELRGLSYTIQSRS